MAKAVAVCLNESNVASSQLPNVISRLEHVAGRLIRADFTRPSSFTEVIRRECSGEPFTLVAF